MYNFIKNQNILEINNILRDKYFPLNIHDKIVQYIISGVEFKHLKKIFQHSDVNLNYENNIYFQLSIKYNTPLMLFFLDSQLISREEIINNIKKYSSKENINYTAINLLLNHVDITEIEKNEILSQSFSKNEISKLFLQNKLTKKTSSIDNQITQIKSKI